MGGRDSNGSNFLNSKKGDDPLCRIRNIDHHLIPCQSELSQGCSKSIDEILQSAIREGFAQINNAGRPGYLSHIRSNR